MLANFKLRLIYAVWRLVLSLVKHRLNPSLTNSPLGQIFFYNVDSNISVQSLKNIGNKTK
ncbi:hypothetical protein KAM398_17400 [Acinetobacter sp. KAM398]|nr:hypothetical protein KAM392_17850 [Acinetobacter sp. KAM392]GJC34570.1 hypothetical protein KAM393_17390 [Acinetobacter sp. KAM393]GJC37436.1 hypothetical protein KAM394_17760 [Acinetobacter sp. KAM394]GJC40263.1 hypothetical protein KAM395_17840 [Acinetobacter sp. KAM395]GJC43039.1 hypothetical protein KAM396_17360 [Acinetobacter sp. KAM396]GJC45945.1 hypothetical protein KAM397_18250 [Acinetobacter sp. KAM397]GJC48688.1 hypothetical protein KAM398_17400 [Acinetobacter sp. KAM398]GJC5001